MRRFPSARAFIDPQLEAAAKADRGAAAFLAMRSRNSDPVPDWVLEKFGLPKT